MGLFEKCQRNQPFTEADKAELLATYRECFDDELWFRRGDLAEQWNTARRTFPSLRPDNCYGNHPQEYRMRAIEIQSSLLDAVLAERGLHTPGLPNQEGAYPIARDSAASEVVTPVEVVTPAREKVRPGPKPDMEAARMVRKIVTQAAGDAPWTPHLMAICEALDEAGIRIPRTWRRRDSRLTSWEDAAYSEPNLARLAIRHYLKNAEKDNFH
jgi:hypothetical protein